MTRERSAFSDMMRVCLGALAVASTGAFAATADISNVPLANGGGGVRANLMLILDNSGSMESDYMPDNVHDLSSAKALCFGFSKVNRIFFDPNADYPVPVNSAGLHLTTPNWPNAYVDGYATSPTNRNLANAPTWNNAQASANGTNYDTFYYVIEDSSGTNVQCPDNVTYKLSKVTTLPAALQTKYLVWYSYYRTRQLMARGAVGIVMAEIDASRFRIGLSAISSNSTADGTYFLNIRDFDAASPVNQKDAFYSKLYSIDAGGSTPLRPALEKIGKYFSNKQLDGAALPSGRDPMQYWCQRNYAILTTDGYWNTSDESNYRWSYAPTRLDGSTVVGNQDDSAHGTSRPMLDDGRYQGNNWVTGGSGVANTLADVARYFYVTDLRTPALGNCSGAVANQDVCTNRVEDGFIQNMSLFTLGMGVAGTLRYQANYDTATSGDFFDIKQGTRPWPNPADPANKRVGQFSTSFTVTERVDDLWHAAVNAGGRFYSAANPADLVSSLKNALASLDARPGAGAAAATSTLQPVAGNNTVYLGMYTTVAWTGNLLAYQVDPSTAEVSSTPIWQAAQKVADQRASRNIYFFDSSATNRLRSFTYANLGTAGLGGYFANMCSKIPAPSQCAGFDATQLAEANNGTNLVDFLRGLIDHENYAGNANSRLFRFRQAPANPGYFQPTALATPLGDLVNATPVFVGAPPFKYRDSGYSTYVGNNRSRMAVVYAAANDGMLHAFRASDGVELWAFVPTAVMSNMYRLADFDYGHLYYVDGGPVAGDVFDGTNWRTILVGGLGAGGRAYYALDVTDPANPKALWEFSTSNSANLGLTFGNPMIAKNRAGTWVVLFASGYNNVSPGDGNGHLYVLNAVTGAQLASIPTYTSGATPAGSPTTPNNLGRISAWVDAETDNTAKRVYGGDMLGNVWRFDFDDNIAPPGNESFLLARAETSGGQAQPITTRPVLTNITVGGTTYDLVTIGTGRLLGTSDVGDTTTQSLYVFKDTLPATGLGVLRNASGMIAQPLQQANGQRTNSTLNVVDWATNLGWYVDLSLSAGERVNIDPIQSGNMLGIASNIPDQSVCSPDGSSWEYFFDITKGFVAGSVYGDAMTAGLNMLKVSLGLKVIRWDVEGKPHVETPGTGIGLTPGATRRISWRELVQ